MTGPRLHLDADASIRAVHSALRERGYDVTRTPCDWMPADADDRAQLLGATAHGRLIFTFNARDFLFIARKYPEHGGILLAAQSRWPLKELIDALDRALTRTSAEEWRGKVRWLNDFR